MRQLRQRIFVTCRLEHLKPREVENYVDRRLFIAGSSCQFQFSPKAKRLIAKRSKGFPRVINKICDYALTAGYVDDEFVIRREHVKRALVELGDWGIKIRFFRKLEHQTLAWTRRVLLAATVSIAVSFSVFLFWQSAQFKSFQNYVAALFLVGQNSSADDSRRPLYAQEGTGGEGYNETHQSNQSLSHEKKHADALNQKQKYVDGAIWTPSYYPFVIQLGSVKTFEQVTRAVSSYALKGLDIHWDWVDSKEKGRWYRIFAGHFESKAEALKAKREHRLRNSLVRFNPWTVLVGQYTDSKILTAIQSLLLENQFDSLIVESAEEVDWLLTGAYATRKGAEKIVKELQKLNCSAQVVPR